MSPPPFQFVVGSRWPGWDSNWSFCLRFHCHALREGFNSYGSTTRPRGSGECQSFKCAEQGCGVKVLLEPSSSSEDPRATIVQASLAHNHPLVLKEDAKARLDAWVEQCDEELRLRALGQLKKLKKGYDFQLVSDATTPIYETLAMQTEILDDIGKILGHKVLEWMRGRSEVGGGSWRWTRGDEREQSGLTFTSRSQARTLVASACRRSSTFISAFALKAKEDLRKEAKEAGVLCEADATLGNEAYSERVWALRGGRRIARLPAASPPAHSPSPTPPPAPQAKAEKKDKQRAPPSPSPTPVAGPSNKRVQREASTEPEVLVLDDSDDEEDVKPKVGPSSKGRHGDQQQRQPPPANAPIQGDLVAFLTSLPPFPYEQYTHLFSRRTIRIDNSEQLLKAVTAVPPCFDYLSAELGKDEVKADGTVEEGMPEFWRMMLRSELLKRVHEEGQE